MKEFGLEKIPSNEITKRQVIDSLVKDPSNYDVYNEWRTARENRMKIDSSPIAVLILAVEATKIVLEATQESGDQILFQDALYRLVDIVVAAYHEGDDFLEKKLFEDFIDFLAEFTRLIKSSEGTESLQGAILALDDLATYVARTSEHRELHDELSAARGALLIESKERGFQQVAE